MRRVEAKALTRERLLEAAGTVFARRGYGGAAVKEIADEAGHTTGALYAHFRGKEDLFLAVLEARAEHQQATYEALSRETATSDLLGGFQQWFESTAASDRDWVLLTMEFWAFAQRDTKVRARLRTHQRRAVDGIAAVITGLYERAGATPPRPPRELAQLALALGNGLSQEVLTDPAVPRDLFAYALGRIMTPATADR